MSDTSSPEASMAPEQNSNNELTPAKQGRKKTKSSVLSDEQKKAHHIASEQKRRENIRSEFDKIVSLTPNLNELENRSELNILTKSADYIDQLREENAKLVELGRMRGLNIPLEYIYSGPKNDGSDIAK
ncbi:Protein INO4 [Candida viswanathii]|uniref:Protein INO4 n=1 Tax=Candida viswanathii TaxID=5486 RepID=A0A367XMJ6_9ASCO|nr:Protein INO4 [Candida viswanathii]